MSRLIFKTAARRPRIDLAGYHHIINRGMNRADVFNDSEDKEMFLKILCKSLKSHNAILHSYCLMDNHYHLLIETNQNNLSMLMRSINANYAIYFNKLKKRTGHLWQGRFKSRYISSEIYLHELLRYIEHNPLRAKITESLHEYPYTSYRQFVGLQKSIPCLKNSLIFQWFETTQEVAEFFDAGEGEKLEQLGKEIQKEEDDIDETHKKAIEEKKPLKEYFNAIVNLDERNKMIKKAYREGWSQHKIAKVVGLSQGMVNRIVNDN